jgi:membrane peptidoglycan carboxypeptidase
VIVRVDDAAGRAVWTDAPSRREAIRPATAFLMNSMLADVITSGTATGARAAGFRLPAAGKTGTTDNYTDAWFIGYTPHLVAGVWFGMDRPAPIMSRGFAAVVAVPAWAEFMKAATSGDKPDWFTPPDDVEKVSICRLSGLRATEACRQGWLAPDYVQAGLTQMPGDAIATSGAVAPAPEPAPRSSVYDEYFPVGAAPSEPCPIHGSAGIMGAIGASDAQPYAVGTTGVTPAAYQPPARLQKVIGPDGRAVWVIKQ